MGGGRERNMFVAFDLYKKIVGELSKKEIQDLICLLLKELYERGDSNG